MDGWTEFHIIKQKLDLHCRSQRFLLEDPDTVSCDAESIKIVCSSSRSVHHNFQRNESLPAGCKELLLLMALTLGTEGLLGSAPSTFPPSAPLQNAIFLQIR